MDKKEFPEKNEENTKAKENIEKIRKELV